MSMERKGSAVWRGRLRDGSGAVSTESGVLSGTQYSFATRFEQGRGTNPEELIAAAHAACFSMALGAQLERARLVADRIQTGATITFERIADAWTITKVHLSVSAKVPNADETAFLAAANTAKSTCPVSRVLNATITMDAHLEP
jgi:lipoyl-dependent peroxiredoxin